MKRLCVFDLDGTLVDSIGDIADAMNRSLRKMGKMVHSTKDYYQMVGDGVELLCRRALLFSSEEEAEILLRLYREDYIKNCCKKTVPYPGVFSLLQRLKKAGVKMAILSNKPQDQTNEVVEKVLGKEYFIRIMGAGPKFPKKPDSAALDDLIKVAGVTKEDVWYIGDSDVDMQLGLAAGVEAIGAAWGFRGERELQRAGAHWIAKDINALAEYILKEEE